MYRALKPGGRFVLHVINRDWIMANYTSSSWFDVKDPRGRSIAKVLEKRQFDYRTSINHGVWHFIQDGVEKKCELQIRMYSYHELAGMFASAGFVDIEGYGSIKDEPINLNQRMMFIFGTKPKRS
jgi:hypothetical protein